MTIMDTTDGRHPEHCALLESLVANAHTRMTQLFQELGRHPTTAGVEVEVNRQIDHDLRAHLHAVEIVVAPELTDEERDHLGDDRRRLLDALAHYETHDVEALRSLLQQFSDHIQLEEQIVLAALGKRVGPRKMATLGLRYTEMADAHLD